MVNDELAIRDLVARYADAVNRRDEAAWRATWAPDGCWQLRGQPVEGQDNVVALWSSLMGSLPFVVQLVHSGTVTVENDSAAGTWYLSEFMQTADGPRSSIGVYRDTYARVAGEWRFLVRRYDLLYSGPPDLSGNTFPFPADG
jgi:uncharacterized protein (TIGR02246 family)